MSFVGASSVVQDYSKPDIASIGGVPIKRLPAGEALGAHDMARWSSNRSGGRSGAYTTKAEREVLNNWKTPQQKRKKVMSDKKYPNSGALFCNHDKTDPKHADYSGSLSVEGVGEFWLNGWIKEGAKGKFLRLSVKPKQKAVEPKRASVELDDEIPF
jgi:hypothetical protein